MKTVVLTSRDKDRVLCVPDALHIKATDLLISYSKILRPYRPSPMRSNGNLLRNFPLLLVVEQSDFRVVVTADYLKCLRTSILYRKGLGSGRPYSKRSSNTQRSTKAQYLVDTQKRSN